MKKIYIFILALFITFPILAQVWEEPFNDIYSPDSLIAWILGANNTIIHTTDGGDSWEDHSLDTSVHLSSICFRNDQNGFIVGENGFVLRTTDGGQNWNIFELGTSSYLHQVLFIDEINGWIAAGSEGLYKTTNGGEEWSFIDYPIVEINFFDSLNGWGKATNGLPKKIVRTYDGGISWIEKYTYSYPGGMSFKFADTLHGFLSVSGQLEIYFYRTSDGCQSWSLIENSPGGFNCIDFIDKSNVWFGSNDKICYSSDFFETYDSFQLPWDIYLSNISVMGISNGWAVGGNYDWEYGRIWKLVGVNEWVEILPAGINESSKNLVQLKTFPNPFTNNLKLEFELKNTSELKISIHNNMGQEIQSHFEGKKTKGKHQIIWDSQELYPGVYFIKLQTDKGITSRKVIKH